MNDRFLLNTHVLIWTSEEPAKLSQTAKLRILTAKELVFSYASIWETAIKLKTAKLHLRFPLEDFLIKASLKYSLQLLHINLDYIYYTQQLSLHHRDPFDRLLIAQSLVENLPVVSSDAASDYYGVQRIWR